jgi:putative nucleotidyltransferase with HDIG domain
MLVPLVGAHGLIGFVDVRDKGAQRRFAPADLDLARSIAFALADQAEAAETARSTTETEPARAPQPPPVPTEIPKPESSGPEAMLDGPGLDDVNTAAADGLVDPRVMAIAVTIASASSGATLIHQRSGTPVLDLDPLLRHQSNAMSNASLPFPGRSAWKTEVRRVSGPAADGRQPVIATTVPLSGDGSCVTVSVIADAEPAVAKEALERIAARAVSARERFHLRITRRGLARRLLQPGDRRYPELVAHSLGVSRLCWSIARVLEFDEPSVENAALAGLLHDVGMRELDYDRLYMHPTPGPEDRRTYRLHVEVGDRIVRVEGFEDIADAVRHHHERWDGNGYPDRLAQNSIPLLARIVHVAEVFDLFTAANSYRPAVSHERALAILERAAGHQFDPKIVDAIAKVVA